LSGKQACRVSWLLYTCAKAQYQAAKLMIYGHFVEKHVTRISRTLQLIPQVLRDTLR